jgi:hypothetical protein
VSLRTIFDRAVTVRFVGTGAEDGRGNETETTTDVAGVAAFRTQVAAGEDTATRDQQARTFLYLLEPDRPDGTPLGLTGWDRIVDGPQVLKVLGSPIVASSRGRPRHVEARAYLIEG